MDARLEVLWLSKPDRTFESDWLRELFVMSSLDVEIKFVDDSHEPEDKPTVLICGFRQQYGNILKKLTSRGTKYGVVLLSDEHLVEPMGFLNDPNCLFCIRNYYKESVAAHPKVGFFGLGYKNGFRETKSSGQNNGLVWSFAGAMRPGPRGGMSKAFAGITPHREVQTASFDDPKGLRLEEYKQMLSDSTFALCPMGSVNADSFRLYESLEAGCIPVVTKTDRFIRPPKNHWELLFFHKNVPFVTGDTWEDCAAKVRGLLAGSPAEIARKRQQCQLFYSLLKHEWAGQFRRAFSLLLEVAHIEEATDHGMAHPAVTFIGKPEKEKLTIWVKPW